MIVSLSVLPSPVTKCHALPNPILVVFVAFLVFVSRLVVDTSNVHLSLVPRSLISWASALVLEVRLAIPVTHCLVILIVSIVVDLFIVILLVLMLSLRLRVFLV